MQEVVNLLKKKGCTISTMESCTGGALVSAITDIEGASEVLRYSAVTYSNEYKIKMGVSAETINIYSVYSMEVAHEMARVISEYTKSDYGVGITGKLNRVDKNNDYGLDNEVFVSVYDAKTGMFHDETIEVGIASRHENKNVVVERVTKLLKGIVK